MIYLDRLFWIAWQHLKNCRCAPRCRDCMDAERTIENLKRRLPDGEERAARVKTQVDSCPDCGEFIACCKCCTD